MSLQSSLYFVIDKSSDEPESQLPMFIRNSLLFLNLVIFLIACGDTGSEPLAGAERDQRAPDIVPTKPDIVSRKIVDYQKVPATPPLATGWQWELTNRSVTIEQEARLDIRHEINPEAKQLWPFHKRLSRRSTVIDPQDLSFRVASAPTREGDIFKMLEFARGTEVPGRESWWKKADRTYTIEIPLEFDGSSVCEFIGEEYLKIWKDYVRAGMVQTPTVRAHDADSMTVTAEFKGVQNHRPSLESSRLIYTAEFHCAIAIANVPVWKFTQSTTTHDPGDVADPNAPIDEALRGNYEGLPPDL